MARKTVGEIFGLLENAKNKKERVELLKKYDSAPIRELIRLNFSEDVKFLLPEGRPPFKPLLVPANAPESGETSLWTEFKKLYLYIEGGHKTLKPIKRELLFIQLLEGLHPSEAEILVKLKDKKLKCGLTRALIDEVYPGLLPPKKVSNASGDKKEENDSGQGSDT